MWTRLLLSLAVVTCVCFSSAPAQIQTPIQQKSPQTIQKPVTPTKVDVFLNVLQNATTLVEVQNAFNRAGLSNAEVGQVKSRIEGSASLKQKLERLQNEARAAMKVQAVQYKQQSASRMAALSVQLNERRAAEFKKGILAIKATDRTVKDPAVRCKADAPSITSVSHVTPGVEFAVEGMGFGEYPGTVELTTGGKTFDAHVTGWNSCTVYAALGDDVSGVRVDARASVSITTTAGKITRALTDFTPVLETYEESKDGNVHSFGFGNHGDWTFWDYVLKNDWYVVRTSLKHYADGHAEISSAPATNVPNSSAKTNVHAAVGGLGDCFFNVTLSLAGPKGLPYN